ncbi:hypothetical protein [Burkholderia alba]|uniref:hypothetical protein n=1 Tax=Burkholderia alba TaxID=2683677 RepID=UPI002B059F5D|nr:hypothetical protein [Burkholderia alba]
MPDTSPVPFALLAFGDLKIVSDGIGHSTISGGASDLSANVTYLSVPRPDPTERTVQLASPAS